ncbi:unnamed protein product [Prorocentrum cordatum]|uniref:Uncharacterized protein n=1 Tax=Prorocentrum cordatum TaxID=2364126 RepID=A0ABN9XNY5_9DINO|nr:unnamed protein product [Polarella glacialis]
MVAPRMTIPKEFMLCPLGHPDKFVRVVGLGLRIQTRDDAPGMDHKSFFALAKFSLWWLPEQHPKHVPPADAGVGQPGRGRRHELLFHAGEGAQKGVPDARVVLSGSTDPRYANLVTVASPFYPGAFRFEGAFWPGHYLAFRPPDTIHMTGTVSEERRRRDRLPTGRLRLHTQAHDHGRGADPALREPGQRGVHQAQRPPRRPRRPHVLPEQHGLPGLEQQGVRRVFRGPSGDYWDFDRKHARVRVRPKAEQLTNRLRRSRRPDDVARAVLCAGEELCEMTPEVVAEALRALAGAPPPDCSPADRRDLRAARARLCSRLPASCETAEQSQAALGEVVSLHGAVCGAAAAAAGLAAPSVAAEAEAEEEAARAVAAADARLRTMVLERLGAAEPRALTPALLAALLTLPLDWVAQHLRQPLLGRLPLPDLLRLVALLGERGGEPGGDGELAGDQQLSPPLRRACSGVAACLSMLRGHSGRTAAILKELMECLLFCPKAASVTAPPSQRLAAGVSARPCGADVFVLSVCTRSAPIYMIAAFLTFVVQNFYEELNTHAVRRGIPSLYAAKALSLQLGPGAAPAVTAVPPAGALRALLKVALGNFLDEAVAHVQRLQCLNNGQVNRGGGNFKPAKRVCHRAWGSRFHLRPFTVVLAWTGTDGSLLKPACASVFHATDNFRSHRVRLRALCRQKWPERNLGPPKPERQARGKPAVAAGWPWPSARRRLIDSFMAT